MDEASDAAAHDAVRSTLREPTNRVSHKAIRMWTVDAVIVSVVLLVPQVVWWLIDDLGPRAPHFVVAAIWLAFAVAYTIAMPRWRFRVHRWEATPLAIYTQTGWVTMERRIAPVNRVQTVDLQRGPIAQLFGLAEVTVTTASAAGPLKIPGLDLPVARELTDALTAAAVVEQGDAT